MNSIAGQLAQVLANVQRPGDFYASGVADMLVLLLEAHSVGRVALPLLPAQAKEIAVAAEQVPYGRANGRSSIPRSAGHGRSTPTWSRFKGRGRSRTLDKIVELVSDGLGVYVPFTAETQIVAQRWRMNLPVI